MYVHSLTPQVFSFLLVLGLGAGCGEKDTGNPAKDSDSGDTAGGSSDLMYDDADEDKIIDIHEGELTDDEDGDGTPNYQDKDADGDGIKDRVEAGDGDALTMPMDSDGDGVADFLDSDSDNDCLSDAAERGPEDSPPVDTDGDGLQDFRDPDNDGDGIQDEFEVGTSCSAPLDTDGDGTADYMDADSDNDGIADKWEAGTNAYTDEPTDSDTDGIPDYLDSDSDNDGIGDTLETDSPDGTTEPRDTDSDGLYDYQDNDADGDGLTDYEEKVTYGTDVYDADSDGDTQSDGAEVLVGTNPLDPNSMVEGVYVEVAERTEVEAAFEFELEISKGDIAFLCDTTCSMSGTANAMASEFGAIVTQLETILEDAAYAYATFDDYNCCGMGSGQDKPFILRQQMTTDIDLVQRALSATSIHSGDDGTESSMEALYQGLSGMGYDHNGDGRLSSEDDVPPFVASASDPFGGTAGESYDPGVPDTGEMGGYGFREFSLPIVVYATDNRMRDPDAGYNTPSGGGASTHYAGSSDVVEAADDLGARLIGICANSSLSVSQMQDLAARTGSVADTDGDGSPDDLLVFTWFGSNEDFRNTVVDAIEQLVHAISFERVELIIDGDDYGFVTDIQPPYYDNIDPSDSGTILEFTLTFRGVVAATTEDQIFKLTLNVVGDETILLDTYDILILVPGNSY